MVPDNHTTTLTGCQGFVGGALMTVVGFGHPYTLIIQQTNPVTGQRADITATSNGIRGPLADAPWPMYLVFPKAKITIRGANSCTSTVGAITAPPQHITFSSVTTGCNCPSDGLNNCYY